MKRLSFLPTLVLILASALALALTGCNAETPEPATPTPPPTEAPPPAPTDTPPSEETPPDEDVIYLNLMWHQHQPLYYKNEEGVYTRPWVRAHATKDYYDMAALLQNYPDVHATFNLTPVLIRQLNDLAAGAKDIYRVLTEIPAGNLSDEQKRFILERFFDANWDNIIARFPRYEELLDLRGRDASPEAIAAAMETFTEQDFRDLQIWWNLAWFDPSFLAQEPLKSLVEKDRNFNEADKETVFNEVDRIVAKIIPLHKQMQDDGQIEVTVTPYAHPILPLILYTKLASVGDPTAILKNDFRVPQDVSAHLEKAVEIYQESYGRPPRGLWPGEGAVAQDIVVYVANNGFNWMATGEHVLAKSLGLDGFTRDSRDVVQEADQLYRPYYAQHKDGRKVAVFFRDLRISDLVGFEYSGDDPDVAAGDFTARIENIRQQLKAEGAEGPHVVSVILDGENAWENYPNDGIDFLNAIYSKLDESDTIITVTPSEYLEMFPEQETLDELWPGAWFSSDYGTWIGEEEENKAWDYLRRTRKDLAKYDLAKSKETTPEKLARAQDFMYLAEGSDWFWWYGDDQESGQDRYFDESFRALLRGVYQSLDEPVPDFVNTPIIPDTPEAPTRFANDLITPEIDGVGDDEEWANAGLHKVLGGAQARTGDIISGFYYGYNANNLYFRLDSDANWSDLGEQTINLYVDIPGQKDKSSQTPGGEYLGFTPSFVGQIALSGDDITGVSFNGETALTGKTLEVALPLSEVGEPLAGDIGSLRVVLSAAGEPDAQLVPGEGPAQFTIPDLVQIDPFLIVEDPPGDDFGPGGYTYPTDAVFIPGAYDLTGFSAAANDETVIFKFDLAAPINNPWGSGINLSVQTFDIYIDVDPGAGTGTRRLLEGRNLVLEEGNGWDYAVWVEGWFQKLLTPNEAGAPVEMDGDNVRVIIDPRGQAAIRIPRHILPEGDPAEWGYAAMVLSQEGFPSAGVRRVRNVEPAAEQWRLGGGPNATNHTRVIDLAYPDDQTAFLSAFTPSTASVSDLDDDDFAAIPLLAP